MNGKVDEAIKVFRLWAEKENGRRLFWLSEPTEKDELFDREFELIFARIESDCNEGRAFRKYHVLKIHPDYLNWYIKRSFYSFRMKQIASGTEKDLIHEFVMRTHAAELQISDTIESWQLSLKDAPQEDWR